MSTDLVAVTVAVAGQYLDRFDQVVKGCEAVGLRVSKRLASLGIITGQIEVRQIARLKAVEGVAAVEESQPYQLPPPESDVQ